MHRPMTRTRRFDLIAFDWDGTLFDSTALIVRCIQAACRDVGVPEPDDERAAYVIGLGLHDALAHAAPGLPPERYPELGARYRHHYFAHQHDLTLFPGTLAMLQALKTRNHWLGVATGKSRRGLDEALAAAQLKGVFDATRTADETASKPDPRMLHEILAHCGVAPAQALMVGDSPFDLLMAHNAGMTAVAVGYGAQPLTVLQEYRPHLAIERFAGLGQWLGQECNRERREVGEHAVG